jgi:hypothetical protein
MNPAASRSASFGASAPPFPPPPPGYPSPGSTSSRGPFSPGGPQQQPSARTFVQRQSPVPSPGRAALNASSPSASSINSPPSPFTAGFSPLAQVNSPMASRPSSSGVMVEYNPQQWGPRGPTGGAYIPHSQLSLTATARDPESGGEIAFYYHIHEISTPVLSHCSLFFCVDMQYNRRIFRGHFVINTFYRS